MVDGAGGKGDGVGEGDGGGGWHGGGAEFVIGVWLVRGLMRKLVDRREVSHLVCRKYAGWGQELSKCEDVAGACPGWVT